jgi:hypothetical protein
MALPTSVTIRGNQNTGDQSLTGGTQLTTMTIRLFADFQKYLEPDETPFSSSVKHGKAVNAKKVEFGIGFLAPHQVTLGATLASGTGTTSVTLAAGDGAKVQVTDVLRITSSTGVEHMWVTAIATDTLTVIRAMGGTTALQHTLATPAQVMEILGPAALENADTPIAPITKGAVEFNYPQIFDYAVQVSQREDNTPDYEFDGASRYDEYLSRIMTNANIDFEKSALMGKRGTEVAMTGATATPTSWVVWTSSQIARTTLRVWPSPRPTSAPSNETCGMPLDQMQPTPSSRVGLCVRHSRLCITPTATQM